MKLRTIPLFQLSLLTRLLLSTLAQIKNGDQACDYSHLSEPDEARRFGHCIKNYVSGSATLSLPPLFPSPMTFVYAVDELKGSEIETGGPSNDGQAVYGPNTKHSLVSFWLQWDEGDVTLKDDALKNPMFTSAAAFFPTIKNRKVGGGRGGCGKLLGKQCLDSLTKTLKKFAFDVDTKGYNSSDRAYDVDFGSPDYPLTLLWNETSRGNITGCPDDMFTDVQYIDDESWPFAQVGSYGNSSMIALQMPSEIQHDDEAASLFTESDAHIIRPGNPSHTHSREIYFDRPLSVQQDHAAVLIMLRTQLTDHYYALDKTRDDDTFDLAFACAQLPADAQIQLDGKGADGGDDDGEAAGDEDGADNSDEGDAGVSVHVPLVVVAIAGLGTTAMMLL